MRNKKFVIGLFCGLILLGTAAFVLARPKDTEPIRVMASPNPEVVPSLIPSPTPIPSPSPKQLTREEREKLYGPCVYLPVLMYHHIDEEVNAKAGNFASLNVTPEYFEMHLQYLKDKNYTSISPSDLIRFFDEQTPLPAKPVMITFDDGYEDFYKVAWPILKKYASPATMFIPTGLMNNSPYMSWDQLADIAKQSPAVYFANHTWSHHSALDNLAKEKYEIETADTQLADHGYNVSKVFAYPYGSSSVNGISVLTELGYKLAFTTTHGAWQCKGQRLVLPRIRIGNAALNQYGL